MEEYYKAYGAFARSIRESPNIVSVFQKQLVVIHFAHYLVIQQTSRAWYWFGYALFGHTYSRHHGRGFVLVTHYLVILTADITGVVLYWLRIIWSYLQQTSRAWYWFGYALFGHTYSRHHGRGFVLVTHYLVILIADITGMVLIWLRIIWSYLQQTSRAWFCFGYALFGHTYSRHHRHGIDLVSGARYSSVVRAFAHDPIGRRIDPSCQVFIVPATGVPKAIVCAILSVGWCI